MSKLTNKVVTTDQALLVNEYRLHGNLIGRTDTLLVNAESGNAITPGAYVAFKVPANGEWGLSACNLLYTLQPLTQTAGTYVRFCNSIAIDILDHIEVWHNGGILSQVRPLQITHNYIENSYVDEWPLLQQQIGYNTSTAARNSAAASVQNLALNLSKVFGLFAQVLPISILKSDIEIRFYFKSLVNFVQADGTAQVFNGSIQLACTYTEYPAAILNALKYAKSPIEFVDYEYTEFNQGWSGGSAQFTMQTPGLTGKDIVTLNLIDRNTSDLTTSLGSVYDNYNALASYNMKVNSLYACNTEFDITPAFKNNVLLGYSNFPGRIAMSSLNMYPITYSADVGAEVSNSGQHWKGSRRFESNDINVTFNYSASVTVARTITVICTAFRRLCLDVKAGRIDICPV